MGCAFSCAFPASRPTGTIKNVRVVHLNGLVEVFDYPISVREVTGGGPKPPAEFVCTPSQLLSSHSKPLQPDAVLEPGHIYLVLPFSTLHADLSPLDLAAIAGRLTAKAKSAKLDKPESNSCRSPGSASPSSLCRYGSSSPMRCPSPVRASRQVIDPAFLMSTSYGAGRSPWRPILDTIREKSFNRRSESDLQEKD